MNRPRILDLYCGAGLVADGLIAAGFEVVGVDTCRQPRYPGPFIEHDALTLDDRYLDSFPAIWASPPCLKETAMRSAPGAKGDDHPELIGPTQRMLDRWAARTGGLFVIENVEATERLRNPVTLCGSMFGLGVDDGGHRFHLERHRKFETNWPWCAPGPCRHQKPVVGIYGGHARNRSARFGGRGTAENWTKPHPTIMAEAMGVSRIDPRLALTGNEISQGIPPAYAEYVGRYLLAQLVARRRAA